MNRQRAVDVAARGAAIGLPVGCAVYAVSAPGSILFGGLAWVVVLAASLAGFGYLVERSARTEVDLGLRMSWGTGLYLALSGVLLAMGWLTHTALAVLVAIGFAGFVWRQIAAPRGPQAVVLDVVRGFAARPLVGTFFVLLGIVVVANLLGAVAKLNGNTYDDDIVYTALIKRALDIGDIDEPFSFRRISAYGGQTALTALAAVRGTLANIYLVDAGLYQLIALFLVLGLIRTNTTKASQEPTRDGPYDPAVVFLLLLVFVLLPTSSINTGSHWTGVVLFLGMYRTVVLAAASQTPSPRLFAILGALAAGACTLRQPYIPAAVLFCLAVLVARLGRRPREGFRRDRALWIATFLGGLIALLPWWIAAWRSNETFLYPLVSGTFNPEIQMQPTLFSPWQELQFFFRVFIEPDPIRPMFVVLPLLFLARDHRPGRPLIALAIASAIGFVLLVHSFPMSDPRNLWRYGFGYALTLFLILVAESGVAGLRQRSDDAPIQVPLAGRVVLVVCMVLQLAMSGRGIATKYANLASDLQQAAMTRRDPVRPRGVERTYAELQLATPAGTTIAVLLDEPFYLDYARNRIINIDTPGFAGFRPGMPMFRGPEPIADYFQSHGIRYLAFVRGDHSRYFYRREMWLRRALLDTELWRILGAYLVDCIDNFAALADSRAILFEQDGLVVLDLEVRR